MTSFSNHKCPTCGHVFKTYKERLTPSLISSLLKLKDVGGVAYMKDLSLDLNGAGNFSKLRKFNLIYKEHNSRVWKITTFGYNFIEGLIPCPTVVYTKEKEIVGEEEPKYINDILNQVE